MGIAGPTLPDLQLLTGASLQQASWLFTGWGIGYLVSCSVSGFGMYSLSLTQILKEHLHCYFREEPALELTSK